MKDTTIDETVIETLEAALGSDKLPPAARDYARHLLRRLSSPVRVTVLGLPRSGKSELINMLVGRRLLPKDCVLPTTEIVYGETERMTITRIDGKRVTTLLLVVLVAVEATDLIFAIDSVAAVLAITTSTFLVWTANAFAVLGLRSLYFCLSGLMRRFIHLHYGLAFLLAFAGVKLILSETPVGKLPIPLTLSVIVVTLAVSIGWSLVATRNRDAVDDAKGVASRD